MLIMQLQELTEMKRLVLLSICLFFLGCENNYRYPCQDPENWDKKQCKKPICEVNRDCPEYIFKKEMQ